MTDLKTAVILLTLIMVWSLTLALRFDECPRGPGCENCTEDSISMVQVICAEKDKGLRNGSLFKVQYRLQSSDMESFGVVEIKCVKMPNWSDFHLGIEQKLEDISNITFHGCDFPENRQLISIVDQLIDNKRVKHYHQSGDRIDGMILNFNYANNLKLRKLSRRALEGFVEYNEIDMSHNKLKTVAKDLFRDFYNLKTLILSFNDLSEIPATFLNLSSLRILILKRNRIQIIKKTTFSSALGLEALDLSDNWITRIEGHSFDALEKLQILYLHGNNLTSLPPNLFINLRDLIDLNLASNNFLNNSLSTFNFTNNEKLQKLNISHNKQNLTTIPEKFLSALFNLCLLVLENSGIIYLPGDLLIGPRGPFSLILSRNYVAELPDSSLLKDRYIVTMNFSQNCLTHISKNFFKNINNIVTLDISYNRIRFIEKDVFETTPIEYANFSNNRIVHFNNNNISIIPDSRPRLLGLRALTNNHIITYISPLDMFFDARQSIELDLRGNKIAHIDLSNVESMFHNSSLAKSYSLVNLQVASNPIECNCSIYHLLRFKDKRMSDRIQRQFYISIDGLTCAGPPELRDIPVNSLNSTLFRCRLPRNSSENRTCPDTCDCLIRLEDGALFVNCSHRDFAQTSVNFNPGSSRSIELNLTGNILKKIPTINYNITVLSLAFNELTNVSLRDLPANLTALYLHGNNLTQLDKQVIQFFTDSTQLQSLSLHGNSWKCDCDTLDFFYFIQSKQSKYLDLQKVTCDSSNMPILRMSSADFCPPSLTMIVGTSMAAILLLITVICAAFYYRFKMKIKVWLFSHQLLPWFVNESELDRDKVYDAFISYSHQDEDFVANTLVPQLEEGPRGFKLCLHHRDWPAGEFISDQIERSVAESRRTIVILSRNFLESQWGQMEFRTAHYAALSEGRIRVIVIAYRDIGPIDEFGAEIASYMCTNTYLQWDDHWFWEKLYYALPHPA